MSSNNLQLTNAGLVESLENAPVSLEVANPLSDIIASPLELQGQTKERKKIKISGYKQQSAAIIHAQADGQVQEKQKSQLKMVHYEQEQHPDGTQSTQVRHDPTKTTFKQSTTYPTGQQQITFDQAQQNAIMPVDNAVSIRPQERKKQQVLSSEGPKSRKKLMAEDRLVTVHTETKTYDTFRKLPLQPNFQLTYMPQIQQPSNALVPIANIDTVTQQPRSANKGSKTQQIIEQRQGIDIQKEIEITDQADNGEHSARNIDRLRLEEIARETRSVVSTPDGDYEHVQVVVERRVIHEAIRQLYEDAQNRKIEKNSGENFIDAANASTFECCMDLFCQVCTCYFKNPFKSQTVESRDERIKNILTPQNILNKPVLRRGRAKGLNLLKQLTFPFVGPGWRIVWILFELLFVLISAGFSIASYVNGSREVFNLVHLVLVLISTVLALIDCCYSLPNSAKLWWKRIREKRAEQRKKRRRQTIQEELIEEEQEFFQPQEHTTSEDSTHCCKCRWCNKRCCKCFEKFSDLARTVLTELLVIPVLICDIFDFIIGFPTYSADFESIAGGILFGFGLIGILLYVYIVRIAILSGMVHYVRKARTGFVTDRRKLEEAGYDKKVARSVLIFQVFFLFHVIGQMIVQIFMLMAVGGVIYDQNIHFYDPSNRNSNINVSPELWYMLVATTVLPVFGFFTFFIVNNYWVQQYPISFCIDLIKALRMPGAEELFDLKSIAKEGAEKVVEMIEEFVVFVELEKEYKDLYDKSFSTKFVFPFQSPGLILLCTLYLAAQLGFVSCVFLGQSTGNNPRSITDSGFEYFYGYFIYVAGPLAFLINIHAFIIPLIWILIISLFTIGSCVLIIVICCGYSSRN